MTVIAVTAAQVNILFPTIAEIYDIIAGATITAGQAIRRDSNGRAALADANAGSGAEDVRGIALRGGGSGQGISMLKRGHVAGFAVSGMAYDAPVYLSDTAGALDDAPSTTNSVQVGRVVSLSDADRTKVIYIDIPWATQSLVGAGGVFVSTEQTGTGSSQNVAHGLGVTPSKVLVAPTEHPGTPDTGAFDIAEGAHDATNVVVTVTANVKFKVLAFV